MKKLLIIFSVLSIFMTGCSNEQLVNPTPSDENEKYSAFSEAVVSDVIVRNHNVAFYDNIYHVYLDVVNENNNDVNYSKLTIRYYNDTALIYSTIQDITSIPPHNSIDISFDIDINLINANRVEYTVE